MATITDVDKFIEEKAKNIMEEMTLREFVLILHNKFYQNVNIEFMDEFLEFAKRENEGKFIIHHEVLIKYGVVVSERSNDIVKRLTALGLIEDNDYKDVLRDISQNPNKGGRPSKVYMLTPDAFFDALMRAKRSPNQTVDPVIYAKYFKFIQKVMLYYMEYQMQFNDNKNKKIIGQKDDKIDQLINQNKDLIEKVDDQSLRINKLLGYAEETTDTLHRVEDDLTETKEEVIIAKDYLAETAIRSTMNQKSEQKHRYFAGTKFIQRDGTQVLKFTVGEKQYVEKTIAKYVRELNHEIILKPFYNANGFDLRNNSREAFVKLRKDVIKQVNAENKKSDSEFNKALRKEISIHNKNNKIKRSYITEKRITPKISVSDISVEFKALFVKYIQNPYISFDDLLNIVIDVNNITQSSPLSDEE